jgi:hypothetical protein
VIVVVVVMVVVVVWNKGGHLDSRDHRHTRDRSVDGLGRYGIRRGRNT